MSVQEYRSTEYGRREEKRREEKRKEEKRRGIYSTQGSVLPVCCAILLGGSPVLCAVGARLNRTKLIQNNRDRWLILNGCPELFT